MVKKGTVKDLNTRLENQGMTKIKDYPIPRKLSNILAYAIGSLILIGGIILLFKANFILGVISIIVGAGIIFLNKFMDNKIKKQDE